MTDIRIEVLGNQSRQVEFEKVIYFSNNSIDEMKIFMEKLCGKVFDEVPFKLQGNKKLKTKTNVWTIADEGSGGLKHRIRMENQDLEQLIFFNKYNQLLVNNVSYYPCFRFSVVQDSSVKNKRMMVVNKNGKVGNLMFYYSPSKIAGRYNRDNVKSNLIIINIHFCYDKNNNRQDDLETQMSNIFQDLFADAMKARLQKMLTVKLPGEQKEFKENPRGQGNNMCCFYAENNQYLTSLGLDPDVYALYTTEETKSFLRKDNSVEPLYVPPHKRHAQQQQQQQQQQQPQSQNNNGFFKHSQNDDDADLAEYTEFTI